MAGTKGWLKDVSGQVAAGLIVLVVTAAVAAAWGPTRTWLVGTVWTWGWVIPTSIVAAFAAGMAVGWKLWSRSPLISIQLPTPTQAVPPPRKPFSPTPMQEEIIRFLRRGDDVWLTAKALTRCFPVGTAVGDVEHACRQLLSERFLKDRVNSVRGQFFTLADKGIEFAQEKGFPPGTPREKQNLRDMLGRF